MSFPVALCLLLAVLVAGIEMFSGTLYLLAAVLGLLVMAGSLTLQPDSLPWALSLGSLTMLLAGAAVYRFRHCQLRRDQAMPDPDLGASVRLLRLDPDQPRQGRVHYRGSEWDADLQFDGPPPTPGHSGTLVGKRANRLIITFNSGV
ncbi:MAG: hypothetical protein RIR00_1870 [Pseudomonadota bacterium]|jgi:membrane protein implicated in regulation of membrane protease activity